MQVVDTKTNMTSVFLLRISTLRSLLLSHCQCTFLSQNIILSSHPIYVPILAKQRITYLLGFPASVALPWNIFLHAYRGSLHLYLHISPEFLVMFAALSINLCDSKYYLFKKYLSSAYYPRMLIAVLSV